MFSRSTFQITAIYDKVLRRVCATFRIETFQGEQQKAIDMFFNVSVSLPTGYEKSFLLKKVVIIFIVSPVKAITEDQVHYLNVLGPRRLSALNF